MSLDSDRGWVKPVKATEDEVVALAKEIQEAVHCGICNTDGDALGIINHKDYCFQSKSREEFIAADKHRYNSKRIWNMLSEGARFAWLKDVGWPDLTSRLTSHMKFEELSDETQNLWFNRKPLWNEYDKKSEDVKPEVNALTAITAVQVICDLQKRMTKKMVTKEIAAAVIVRLNALTGELAAEFDLPTEYYQSKHYVKKLDGI